MGLSHLRAETPIEYVTNDPRPFPIVNLFVTSSAFLSVLTCNGCFSVQIQVCSRSTQKVGEEQDHKGQIATKPDCHTQE